MAASAASSLLVVVSSSRSLATSASSAACSSSRLTPMGVPSARRRPLPATIGHVLTSCALGSSREITQPGEALEALKVMAGDEPYILSSAEGVVDVVGVIGVDEGAVAEEPDPDGRGPQSLQSWPSSQFENCDPGPPSWHMPLLFQVPVTPHESWQMVPSDGGGEGAWPGGCGSGKSAVQQPVQSQPIAADCEHVRVDWTAAQVEEVHALEQALASPPPLGGGGAAAPPPSEERGPQSLQSWPSSQFENCDPGPPSWHMPSLFQ